MSLNPFQCLNKVSHQKGKEIKMTMKKCNANVLYSQQFNHSLLYL